MAHKNSLQKLELTWIGKGDEPKLEPRILIENPEYSYGDPNTENMLIHGDNLLALKALEQKYAGKVKCIYIDPPYNTGSAFEHYDDGIEHSLWLSLMSHRLNLLKTLLTDDGFIFVNIDDNEIGYLTVIMDEIFSRDNKFDQIAVKTSSSQGGFGGVNPGLVSNTEYILIYSKNRSKAFFNEDKLFVKKEYDENYKYFISNLNDTYENWNIKNLNDLAYKELGVPEPYNNQTWRLLKEQYGEFWDQMRYNVKSKIALENPQSVFRTFNPNKPAYYLEVKLRESKLEKNKNKIIVAASSTGDEKLCYNGEVILFYDKMMREIDGEYLPVKFLTTFWDDLSWEGISSEGNVKLRNGKKPEALIKRIIDISTKKGDIVLDSFLGSGTTSAVAQKMGRRWIGIELGEHAKTHCYPRLKQVVDGEQGGISKAVNWQGSGGFKFYTLAPSLLNQDKFGNWVISTEYNAQMLAAAMAKQEGFYYNPHESLYWKQGQSAEQDFIFTTTQFLTVESLDSIKDEMQPDETLLICCKSFQKECKSRYGNITIKKIPQMLLGRCEFAKDDYSFNIVNSPVLDAEGTEDDIETISENTSVQEILDKKKKENKQTDELPGLFD